MSAPAEGDSTLASNGRVHRLIEPRIHEVSGNLIFGEAGLLPYYSLSTVTEGQDYSEPAGTFRRNGQQWVAKLKPKASGLKPQDNPGFEFKTVKEFSLQVEPKDADDQTVPPSVTFMIAPRWPNLESKGDSPNPSNPGDLEGVNVRFDGSNLPP